MYVVYTFENEVCMFVKISMFFYVRKMSIFVCVKNSIFGYVWKCYFFVSLYFWNKYFGWAWMYLCICDREAECVCGMSIKTYCVSRNIQGFLSLFFFNYPKCLTLMIKRRRYWRRRNTWIYCLQNIYVYTVSKSKNNRC